MFDRGDLDGGSSGTGNGLGCESACPLRLGRLKPYARRGVPSINARKGAPAPGFASVFTINQFRIPRPKPGQGHALESRRDAARSLYCTMAALFQLI